MRSHPVELDTGQTFPAAEDETVIAAAERAGIALASSCRNGTCRTCLRRLHSGSVAYVVEWPGLTPEEKSSGWVLPCVAQARSPLVLGQPAQPAWWA